MSESLDLKKKKIIAFQTSYKIEDDDDKDLNFEIKSQDDEMALIARKFLNMYRKRGGFKNKQPPKWDQNKGESSFQPLICFEGKRLGHKRTECPMLKKKSHKRLTKRKAMIVVWDGEYIPSKEE